MSKFRSVGVRTETEGSAKVESAGIYAVGQRVSHARFGVGVIEAIERLTSDTKLTVRFDNGDVKNLLAKYAKLKIES